MILVYQIPNINNTNITKLILVGMLMLYLFTIAEIYFNE